jgi:hypothetical protein
MKLGNLISHLEEMEARLGADHVCVFGFANPHSWRGNYDELAFEPATGVTIATMLIDARSAVGNAYQGWKGGVFTMDESTPVHIAEEGCCPEDDDITPAIVEAMGTLTEWPKWATASPQERRPPSGFIPDGHVICPECHGRIFYGPLFSQRECSTCDLHGYVPRPVRSGT